MNTRTFNATNAMDKAVIASLMLKTRMTMGPNNPMIAVVLTALYDNLDWIQSNYEPDWFTDEEVDWINSTAADIMIMAQDPQYTHLFDGDLENE
jgi:hypothetical protein|tara:strand:- start:335 stop:616 length:282 start_codon:yes stop_codon:yes gene_type:complete